MEDVSVDGAKELGQVTFQRKDTPNNGDDAGCDKTGTKMYTEYYDGDGPVTVVCEDMPGTSGLCETYSPEADID